ncbi:MAG: SRPBCC family protein [Haloarculaceae archaeon]
MVSVPGVDRPRIEGTPDGRRVVVDRVVAAPPDDVWTLLTDTERWPEWGPSVSDVRSEDRFVTEGTTGRVQVVRGPWVPFAVDTCADYRWTWSVARIPATGHRVEPVEEGTRVAFEIPVVAAGYALVCRWALDRIQRIAESESESESG